MCWIKWPKRTSMIHNLVIFPASFAGQGVLNKDLSFWIDGAWPANTCIPPSIPGNATTQPSSITTPIITFKSIKKYQKNLQNQYTIGANFSLLNDSANFTIWGQKCSVLKIKLTNSFVWESSYSYWFFM